jgi:putative nucleotidyltransferase with HDIG domain
MLSHQEAMQLLSEYGQNADWTKHCFAVANAAKNVGHILEKSNPINCAFLWSAALLHDIGRYKTHDPLLHGVEGYILLSKLGHDQEAYVCASHLLYGLNATDAKQLGLPNQDFKPQTIEEKLIPLIDFLIEFDQPTTLNNRFSSLRKRNEGNIFFLNRLESAYEIASVFMTQIDEKIGMSVESIVASYEGGS